MVEQSRQQQLQRLLEPRSIALLGATAAPDSYAYRALRNLRSAFSGRLVLVNPRYTELDGLPCYGSLAEAPGDPADSALILTQASAAVDLLEDCVRCGVPSATVITGGFGDGQAGNPGNVERLRAVLESGRIAVCGPNTIGLANFRSGAIMIASGNVAPEVLPGGVAVVTQSGGVGFTLLNRLVDRGIGIGHFVATGNAIDVGLADVVAHLADDDATSCVLLYAEGVPDLRRLAEVAGSATQNGKLVVALKGGRSDAGARMAASHTGALSGQHLAFHAAMLRGGAVEVDRLEDAVELVVAHQRIGTPCGPGIGVVGLSGGLNVLTADRAAAHELALPDLEPETMATLSTTYPFATPGNPFDPTGLWRQDVAGLRRCIAALRGDPGIGTVVVVLAAMHAPYARHIVAEVVEAARLDAPAPVVAVLHAAGELTRSLEEELVAGDVVVFRSLDTCFAALARLVEASQRLDPGGAEPTQPPDDVHPAPAQQLLLHLAAGQPLDERTSKQVAAAYGISVVDEILVDSETTAAEAGLTLGYPVVVKALVQGVSHKAVAGHVRLGLIDENAVIGAYRELSSTGGTIVVQPQLSGHVELLVGTVRDPQLGPMVVLGTGGSLAEAAAQVTARPAPISEASARDMVAEVARFPLMADLTAYVHVDGLVQLLVRVGWFLEQQPSAAELDLNPVLLTPEGPVAVDALIVGGPPSDDAVPR